MSVCSQIIYVHKGNHYGNRQTSIKRMEKQEKIGCLLFSFLSHKVAPHFGHPQLTPAAMKQVALMVDGKAHILCDCHNAIVNSLGRSASCTWRSFHP